MYETFKNNGGILRTFELNKLGFYSREINRLIDNKEIRRIKHGFYELFDNVYPEEVVIARLFPDSVIFLASALMIYGYTDRVPMSCKIAVDKNSEKTQYQIDYPLLDIFYIEPHYLSLGVDTIQIEGLDIKIFNRDRTICDVLRYENKLDREVFTKAIHNYISDPKKNIGRLIEYSEKMNIKNKMRTYIGLWL